MKRVRVFSRFERFWHWTQALLVLLLIATGFEVRFAGFEVLGFEKAVRLHQILGVSFLALIGLAVFWHFTTGEWKQYVPTKAFLGAWIRFYLIGIFQGAPHPVKRTILSKLNPLQRLAYLGLKVFLIPVLATTGAAWFWFAGCEGFPLRTVASVHVLAAYALSAFVAAHVYLGTTGRRPFSNFRAMITGWEDMDESVPVRPK